jgi:hypothetical protein
MKKELSQPPKDLHRINCLLYLSFMFRFYEMKPFDINRPEYVVKYMNRVPKIIIDSLFHKFTETLSNPKNEKR